MDKIVIPDMPRNPDGSVKQFYGLDTPEHAAELVQAIEARLGDNVFLVAHTTDQVAEIDIDLICFLERRNLDERVRVKEDANGERRLLLNTRSTAYMFYSNEVTQIHIDSRGMEIKLKHRKLWSEEIMERVVYAFRITGPFRPEYHLI